MGAVTAVQEALLHTGGPYTIVAGGMAPEDDGEFWGLRTSSGDIVSAAIEKGRVVEAELRCGRSGARRRALDPGTSKWDGNRPFATDVAGANTTVLAADFKEGENYRFKRA